MPWMRPARAHPEPPTRGASDILAPDRKVSRAQLYCEGCDRASAMKQRGIWMPSAPPSTCCTRTPNRHRARRCRLEPALASLPDPVRGIITLMSPSFPHALQVSGWKPPGRCSRACRYCAAPVFEAGRSARHRDGARLRVLRRRTSLAQRRRSAPRPTWWSRSRSCKSNAMPSWGCGSCGAASPQAHRRAPCRIGRCDASDEGPDVAAVEEVADEGRIAAAPGRRSGAHAGAHP